MVVRIVRGPDNQDLPLPSYATPGSAGADLRSNVNTHIPPGSTVSVGTGLHIELWKGFEGQIRSRSGMAANGVVVANSPGTIDSDYRGEVKVLLHNNGHNNVTISRGDRIAQIVFAKCEQAYLHEAKTLNATSRGDGGFGSTGTK